MSHDSAETEQERAAHLQFAFDYAVHIRIVRSGLGTAQLSLRIPDLKESCFNDVRLTQQPRVRMEAIATTTRFPR